MSGGGSVADDCVAQGLSRRRIGFVAFDGLTTLDLLGPFEVFGMANGLSPEPLYELTIIAPTKAPVLSDSGVRLLPDETFEGAAPVDTLITPGGPGLRLPETNTLVADWLKAQAPATRRMVAVCTGLFGLAATGLLDGRRVATHWHHAAEARRCFPNVTVDASVLFVEDFPFFTSAGISAGIDLALALLERDHGPALALAVARMLVVYLKRPGGQLQFSEPLRFQTRAKDRFADLAAWLPEHLTDDLSVEALARRSNMSPRHFARSFKSVFGTTAADFVERLRLDAARERLGASNQTVESVGLSVGFRSADVFRRAFVRRFGASPSTYGQHFGTGR
jgi:transcriptional regulator GlxA family with amidase domain